MDNQFAAARDFILRQGRLLERRLFATCFEGAQAAGVIDALGGYRNDDGGFGHGLEPDKRCPASLPIDVEIALQTLAAAGTVDQPLVVAACDYLAKVAADVNRGGAVPLAFPVIEAYPRAEHWTDWTYAPGLNPTAGLVGLLRQLRVHHAWVDEAPAGAGNSSPQQSSRPTRTRCGRFWSSSTTPQNGTGLRRPRTRSGTSLPRRPGSGSIPTIPAMGCRRSASRLLPTVGGASCSAKMYLTPIWTGCRAISSLTAAGRSAGSRRVRRPVWSGAVQSALMLCAPSCPTVGSGRKADRLGTPAPARR